MIFLKTAFCSGGNSLFPPAVKNNVLLSVQIFDGTYNQLYLSTDTKMTVNNLKDDWSYDTKMNAVFDTSLDAGNSGFSLRNTDHIVIRRREYGTAKWTVVYVKKAENISDFNIQFIDKYARSGINYEYSVSSFVNGVENSYLVNNVYSEFDGYYITDKDCLYGTIYNVDNCDTSRAATGKLVELLNSKYMSVVSGSQLNCESGSITGSFFQIDEATGKLMQEDGLNYRSALKNRLANKKPLILKVDDGRIWMIRVSGDVRDSANKHRNLRDISFEWVEIGDFIDMQAIYRNGFSDVDSRWW